MKLIRSWWGRLSTKGRVVVALSTPFIAVSSWVTWYGLYVSREPVLTAAFGNATIWYEAKRTGCLPWDLYLGPTPQSQRGGLPEGTKRGDMLVFLSKGAQPVFKDGTYLFKFVAGMPGDRIVVRNDRVYVNGALWGTVHAYLNRAGLPAGHFDREFTVPPGELFMLGTEERTFDGRYWGTIKYEQVIARLTLLG